LYIQVIAKARVPIVKFTDRLSGYNFDISFDMPSGPQAAGYVKELVAALPQIRPLLLVNKVRREQRSYPPIPTHLFCIVYHALSVPDVNL
jgi:non-canonical poly(A) RNA polymerase PAPD5/7